MSLKKWLGRSFHQRIMPILSSALVLFAVVTFVEQAKGDDGEKTSHEPITFVFENDLFAGTDRGYTNGVILSFAGGWQNLQEENERPNPFTSFIDSLSLVNAPNKERRHPITFGQVMVTPENIEVEQLIVDDVPYAGLLFGKINYEYRTERRGDKFGLLLGVIGPSSRAEETQKFVHKITDSTEPKGWDNQLHDEPAFNIDYEHMWKLYDTSADNVGGYSTDFSTYMGVSLGNIMTDIDSGLIARWGLNLSPLPNSVYKGGIGAVPDVDNSPNAEWSFYLMAGMEVSYMAYTVFLDGNTWEDDTHSVDRVPEQASIFWGFGCAYDRFRLNMFMLRGTEKYTDQNEHTRYGSVTVGWVF